MRIDEVRLIELVRSTPWVLGLLEAARDVNAPNWLIGAGLVRTLVWDHLHGFIEQTPLDDVDLIFFDATCTDENYEREVCDALLARASSVRWDVKNQAAVHLWYERRFGLDVEPLRSSADAVATFPETATAVAMRLHEDDRVEVVAPLGLDDLFGLVCRHNPRRASVEEYHRRIQDKRIAERWPRVKIIA